MVGHADIDIYIGRLNTVEEKDLLSLHRVLAAGELMRALGRISIRCFSCHSISIYFNYLEATDPLKVLHKQWFPGRPCSWEDRRRVSPAGDFLRSHPGVRIYRLNHLIPHERALRRSAYFNQVMKEEGWRHLLVAVFWWQGEPKTLVAFRRTEEQGEFTSEERAWVERMYPLMEAALERIRRVQSCEIRNLSLSTSLEHLRQGALLCTWDLHPVFSNREGARSCADWRRLPSSPSGRIARRACLRLPPEIVEAAQHLRRQWEVAHKEETRTPLLVPRSVTAVADCRLAAMIQIIRSIEHPLSEPLFLIQFVDAHTREEWIERHSLQRNIHLEKLTPCEQDVTRCVLAGMSNRRIGVELNKSVATVKAQLTSIYRKLDVENRAALIVHMK